jgi:transcriptional regulator with XRE-family HTH domain
MLEKEDRFASESGDLEGMEKIIGKRLREARLQEKITQKQLGKLVGISFQQIQKYESGKNRISASRLYEISQLLGFPFEFFFID